MAKIIRCPNCGENVEIPPNASGQIVTCIACGTAMRLKSKKDSGVGGEKKAGDSSHGSLSGSMSGSLSGSMSATRITSDSVQATGDDPPDLGSTCDVCGRSVDASELTEDRGKLACRDCIKGARSSRPRALKSASEEDLIPFSGPSTFGPSRAGLFTFGMPFFAGVAALVIYIACSAILAFNPKPVGTGVIAKNDQTDPPKSVETKWDIDNLAAVKEMIQQANTLKSSPTGQTAALQKYEEIIALAKGQEIGSQEMRSLVDTAEREAETLRAAAVTAPPPTPEPVAKAPGEVVPDSVAPQGNSVFDDPEVQITEKLNTGITQLERAVSGGGDGPAQEALVRFSESRSLLIKEKRNIPEDPGWALSLHGTAVGYLLTRNHPLALEYLDRLPQPPPREAVVNRVVCLLQMRENKGEAITLLLDYLNTEANTDDGYALNLLGTTLARYPADVIKADATLTAAAEKYDELVKKLAAKHPGEKRWGARWIGVTEWNAKDKERRISLNKIEDMTKALTRAQSRIAERQKTLDRGGTLTPKAQSELNIDRGEETRLKQQIEAERAKIPPEEWLTPEQIVPVLPDVTAVNARSRGASPATTKAADGG